jgi:L-ribulokinase
MSSVGPETATGDGCVVGVDFGTLSGRAVVVRVADGPELGRAVHPYAHAVVGRQLVATGGSLPPDWALQVPGGWADVLKTAVPEALAASGIDPADVIVIGTDFTACTVRPTTTDGTPLCDLEQFRARPHAYPKLWKHHAAQPHADRINVLAEERDEAWLPCYGRRISSEWEFAKALQLPDPPGRGGVHRSSIRRRSGVSRRRRHCSRHADRNEPNGKRGRT